MTLDKTDYDTARQAIAFARAWLNDDRLGANQMFLTIPAHQLPGFASSLCLMLQNALAVGSVEPASFFDALSHLLDHIDPS